MSIETEGIGYARGRFISLDEPVIPIDDRAHQFGDGIYEVIRVYGGKPHFLADHMARFERSAKAIDLSLDRPIDQLVALIEESITRAGFLEAQVYFQLSRGIVKRDHAYPTVPSHLSLTVRPVDDTKFYAARQNGQRVILAEDIRWKLCYIKSLNLLPNVMTKQKALDAGVNDALFVRDGFVTEGTSSNLAMVKEGKVITHPATEHILHGITRAAVLSLCGSLAIPVEERRFTPSELMAADEIFTMSTLTEIAPVVEIDGQAVAIGSLEPNSIVRRIQSAYKTMIE